MARMTQEPFGADGRFPNSLRCIDKQENGAMGNQLRQFIQGVGGGLEGRTCEGPLKDDSTFKIKFNYDGADASKLGFCKDLPGASAPDPENQFHMTHLGGGSSGRISFPYDPSKDNHYAIATTKKDVLQCKVKMVRGTSNYYIAEVFDSTGEVQGGKGGTLDNAGDQLTVPGKGGLMDLAIFATGPVGDPGTTGSRVDFNYGAHTFLEGQPGTDFAWDTTSTGTDGRFSRENPDTTPGGGYCSVPNIDGDTQKIICYFPCNAA